MKKKISKKTAPKHRRLKRSPKLGAASKKESAHLVKSASEKIGLFNLKPARGAYTPRKILGRGPSSGHGKTSTRGSKGQTSRSGKRLYLGFEGGQMPLMRKVPKRGFVSRSKLEYQIVNLEDLVKIKDDFINPQILEEKGLIKNKTKPIKILGNGEIKEAKTLQAHSFSKKAEDKIKNAGGKVEVLNA